MTSIHFVKYHCLENDFCLIEPGRTQLRLSRRQVAELCHRRRGVGADGLIILGPSTRSGIGFKLYNADGSRAEWSGNGVRCAAAYLCRRKRSARITLLTGAGPIEASATRKDSHKAKVSFQRPMPAVLGALGQSTPLSVRAATGPIRVDAGNPHWIYLVRNFDLAWEAAGERLQRHARRTHGVNVEFVHVVSRKKLEMRIYERGVGPTPSSGSGALAALAACWDRGLIDRNIALASPGGEQLARIDEEQDKVELTATAHLACAGVWERD